MGGGGGGGKKFFWAGGGGGGGGGSKSLFGQLGWMEDGGGLVARTTLVIF